MKSSQRIRISGNFNEIFRSVLNILRTILHSDGGVNYILANYETICLLKTCLDHIYNTYLEGNDDLEHDQNEIDPRFATYMFGNREFPAINSDQISSFSRSTVLVVDILRDLVTIVNKYFSSLYSLSDDQSIISHLVSIASSISHSWHHRRCLLMFMSQNRMLSSLLEVLKVKSAEALSEAKFDIAVVLDIVMHRRLIL
jgi:hypothetical protein